MTKIIEKITGKKLVRQSTVELLAKISGWMMITYVIAKTADTVYWAGMYNIADFYTNNPGSNYGYWILFTEIVLCGFVPALILITPAGRKNPITLTVAIILGCIGVSLNRWVMVVQVMAVPILPFESFAPYFPSWQEIATTILPVAYGVILISLSYRYLPVFPDEAELNPIEEEVAAPEMDAAAADEEPGGDQGAEPAPAEA